jgi:AraC-like DNA-binding protein
LISDYSVENLASETKNSVKKLSLNLQKNTNYGFPDYINLLRVQKAKKYLINPKYADYTIIAIGLECGFNSKSTFYRAFTKLTGTTPTEHRQKNT